jgi:adenylosuccinate lyase
LKQDPAFAAVDLEGALEARRYIGRAPQQVDAFLADFVEPVRQRYAAELQNPAEALRV